MKNATAAENLIKIRFPLKADEWIELKAETLWAKPVASGEYLIRSIPFYVYGISFGDTVYASLSEEILCFAGVARRGGHSTYRLLLPDDVPFESQRFLAYWKPLESLGCTFELARKRWLAVDVPADVDIYQAYSLFEKGEADGVWSFDEGHCGRAIKT